MALPVELTAGVIVRGASAVLFVLFGLACMLLQRRAQDRRITWGLALHGIGFGVAFVSNNLALQDEPDYAFAVTSATLAGWILSTAGLALVLRGVWPRAMHERALVLGALALYAGSAIVPVYADAGFLGTTIVHPPALPLYLVGQSGQRLVGALLVACALSIGLHVRDASERRPALVVVAFGLALWPAFAQATNYLTPPTSLLAWLPRLGTTPVLLLAIVVWLRAVERGAGRGALVVALAIPAAMLFSVATSAFGSREFVLEYRNGVVRTVAVAALALAVFRHDLVGTRLRDRTARRASGATVGLASLFIVAQVAQTYFSASGGLLVGGAVAGALLFAASSVQRKIETRPASDKETSFRAAVRMALKDGHITREEERHLVVLADHLGIRPARAYELRDEEERARGAR